LVNRVLAGASVFCVLQARDQRGNSTHENMTREHDTRT